MVQIAGVDILLNAGIAFHAVPTKPTNAILTRYAPHRHLEIETALYPLISRPIN